MLLHYTLECGHVRIYRKHVKLKDGKRYCKKCKEYKQVTDISEDKTLTKFIKEN